MEVLGEFEYSKKDLIGHGAFAVVFKGRHRKKHDHVVAIKSITKKNLAKSQNLLSKEIKILKELSGLHHENVVALLDCKETSNHVNLVMEYCNGGDLADYLQAKGTLSEDTIASFLRQIAGAMKALNAKGIVHRDLKPQNILLCHECRTTPPPHLMKLKIADFGFARFLQDGVMAATLCGSPMYMAPEVLMSLQYDAKADLWSVGTIVYQCLTGKAPFQAQTPQQLKMFYEKNANLVPVIPSGTSPHLRNLLCGLLKRNAKDRIEFDVFFTHPFHSSRSARKSASSSPVPVPRRSASVPSVSSSPRSSPSVKPVSSSPLSGRHIAVSPPTLEHQKLEQRSTESMEVGSSHEATGFLKVHKDDTRLVNARSVSPTEDYVLVPENLPSDHSAGSAGSARPPSSVDLNAIFSDNSPDSPKHKPAPIAEIPDSSSSRKMASPVKATSPHSSPTRPSSLPMLSPSASPHSEPIPVPSQVKAYEQIQRASPSSPSPPAALNTSPRVVSPVCSAPQLASQGINIPTQKNSIPDIVSMSPPSVQFTIGTPPNTTWRRSSLPGTPPNVQGSPLRRSGTTPPRITPPNLNMVTGQVVLPPILGSPTKASTCMKFPCDTSRSPTAPLQLPFGSRTKTCPGNLGAIGYLNRENHDIVASSRRLERVATEPYSLAKRMWPGHSGVTSIGGGGGGKLSEQLIKAALGTTLPSPPSSAGLPVRIPNNPTGGALVPYGSSSPLHRDSSRTTLMERTKSLGERESTPPTLRRRSSSGCAQTLESPPSSLPYCQSPPNMEGPIQFVAPELAEETLMDKEHNETVAKLNFVLALVDCILELARSRSTPLTESVNQRTSDTFTLDHISFVSEGQRRMEQLVLYVRALQLLTSSLQLAREEIKALRLQPSNSVKAVLKEMNDNYHHCLMICKDLNRQGVSQCPGINPTSAAITADKLIYSYAIEMCQTAALDELFGNPQECFRRYRNAQILLHSLSQQTQDENDRILLNRYKESVEKRLYNLQSQGMVFAAYDS